MRVSSAAMIAAWKPPPLVPVMLTWAESTSASSAGIHRAHAVPHFPSREAGAGEVGQLPSTACSPQIRL
jgi:hypothetical protein